MKNNLAAARPLIVLFIILTALFISLKSTFAKWQTDGDVLIIGNLVVFVTVMLSFFIMSKASSSTNSHAFLRAMYGSFIIKFFVLAIGAFIYIMMTKENVNKPALMGCMGLYFIYTFLEISLLMKMLRKKKNA